MGKSWGAGTSMPAGSRQDRPEGPATPQQGQAWTPDGFIPSSRGLSQSEWPQAHRRFCRGLDLRIHCADQAVAGIVVAGIVVAGIVVAGIVVVRPGSATAGMHAAIVRSGRFSPAARG